MINLYLKMKEDLQWLFKEEGQMKKEQKEINIERNREFFTNNNMSNLKGDLQIKLGNRKLNLIVIVFLNNLPRLVNQIHITLLVILRVK